MFEVFILKDNFNDFPPKQYLYKYYRLIIFHLICHWHCYSAHYISRFKIHNKKMYFQKLICLTRNWHSISNQILDFLCRKNLRYCLRFNIFAAEKHQNCINFFFWYQIQAIKFSKALPFQQKSDSTLMLSVLYCICVILYEI